MTVGLRKISYIYKKILKDILYLELGFSTDESQPHSDQRKYVLGGSRTVCKKQMKFSKNN